MMRKKLLCILLVVGACSAQPIALGGKAAVYILRRSQAGVWEKRAAIDLAHYMGQMSGVTIPVQETRSARGYPIVVGELALQLRPELRVRLQEAAKKNPVLRSDAIVISSTADGTYLAGSNDDSHYFAVAQLLRRWGCRWYLPTDFGECIPQPALLRLEPLELTYAPPFEVRSYWLSWVGDPSGYEEFAHRNFFNLQRVAAGHALGKYLQEVQGKFEVTDAQTAAAVAQQLLPQYQQGKSISLSMEDATVSSSSQADTEVAGRFRDKYFNSEVFSDAYLLFYNRVCEYLIKISPDSSAKIGFLAYINLTLPPQRGLLAQEPLICYLAGIDTDPNHSFADPRWSSKQDLLGALRGWVKVMQGRVIIYDYDQSMLVWRDLPNPSHQVVKADVQEYRRLGILGIDTESRGATATTFLNLYFRGQLYWNPDLDVEKELKEFYPAFFGPAAPPMERYWQAIYQSWADTSSVEHEYFLIPVVYPRKLVDSLRIWLEQASVVTAEPYRSRVQFVARSYALLEGYTRQLEATAKGDYQEAAQLGQQALDVREQLTQSNPTFTTYKNYPEKGPAFWPGEIEYLRDLAAYTDGPKGKRILQSPVSWDFRADPEDHGIWQGWADSKEDWSPIRTDLYLQAQREGSPHGFAWYRWQPQLTKKQAQDGAHLTLPGIFNECWLYVNGNFLAHREQKPLWWQNDYRFQWDVPLGASLHEGSNSLVVRTAVPLHFAGVFRPPFLYAPTQ